MDKSGKMTCAMIEAAVDKGLRDIEENPRRGIRNLVDLGTQLIMSLQNISSEMSIIK